MTSKIKAVMGLRFYRIVVLQFLAGIFENLSIFALLPLIYVALNVPQSPDDKVFQTVSFILENLNIPQELAYLLGLFVVLILLKSLFTFFANYSSHVEILTFGANTRWDIIDAVFSARWSFFLDLKSGKYGNLLTGEITKIVSATSGVFVFMNSLNLSILYMLSAVYISWELTILAIIIGLVSAILFSPLVSKSRTASKTNSSTLNNMTSFISEMISSIKSIKAMGLEMSGKTILKRENQVALKSSKTTAFGTFFLKNVQQPVVAVVISLVVLVSIYYFDTPVANLAILLVIFNRSLIKILELQSAIQKIAVNEGGYNNITQSIEAARLQVEDNKKGLEFQFKRGIKLEDVSLKIDDNILLENVNLEIPNKGLFVFCGESGSGKTSLIDTIIGLRSEFEGKITFDNAPIQKISKFSLREHVGYAPQDLQLFNTSIKDNILMANPEATPDQLNAVIEASCLTNLISRLKNGIDTNVGQTGSVLSGGQRQRIILARALIRQPQILVLDEVTSALDADIKLKIFTSIRNIAQNKCILLIAHDEVVHEFADSIYKVENGSVVKI